MKTALGRLFCGQDQVAGEENGCRFFEDALLKKVVIFLSILDG